MGHYDYEHWPFPRTGRTDKRYWTTRTGNRMLITEMDDQHLQNSIAMIERGYDKDHNPVLAAVRARLPELKAELERRNKMMSEKCDAKETKVDTRKYDFVDVRFSRTPDRIYTYYVRKGAKIHLGMKLVVTNEQGDSIVFVVGINTGRTGYKEITEKVTKV